MPSVCARVFVAQSPAPIAIPLFARLAANLAGVKRFLYGGFDALADGVTFVIEGQSRRYHGRDVGHRPSYPPPPAI